MNKLSKGQLFSLVFTIGAFFVFSGRCAQNFSELIGDVFSAAMNFLIILAVFFIVKNKTPNIFINSLMFLVLLSAGAGGVASFFNAQNSADFGISHKLLCAILLGLAVIYCASTHINAAARSSVIIFALTLFSLILLIVGAAPKFNISRLDLDFDLNKAVIFGVESSLCTAILPVSVAIMLKFLQAKSGKHAAFGTLCSALLSIVLSILSLCINKSGHLTYFELAKSAQPFSVQSGEWIYIVIYGMLGVLCLSVTVNLSAAFLTEIFPKLKFKTVITALLTFACAYFMSIFSIDTKTILAAASVGTITAVLILCAKNLKLYN